MKWKSKKTFHIAKSKKDNTPKRKNYNIQEFKVPKGIFSNFIKDIVNPNAKKVKRLRKLKLFQSPAINEDVFQEKLKNLSNLSVKETMELTKSSYREILLYLDNTRISSDFETFFSCLSEHSKEVHFDYKFYTIMNNIAYNSIMYSQVSNSISKSILEIAERINTRCICNLSSYSGVDTDLCNLISIAKLSTDDELISVDRVSKMLCLIGDVFTLQNIIDIFECLFDKISIVFSSVVTIDIDSKLSEKVMEMQIKAIVLILNQLPDDFIRQSIIYSKSLGIKYNKWFINELQYENENNYRVIRHLQMLER